MVISWVLEMLFQKRSGQIGYQVDLLADEDITLDRLKQYNTVIAGVRAYNTNKRMKFHQPILMDYVEQGGNYICAVQYFFPSDFRPDWSFSH